MLGRHGATPFSRHFRFARGAALVVPVQRLRRGSKGTGQNARTRPGAVIEGDEHVLIDAPPELRLQCSRERSRRVLTLRSSPTRITTTCWVWATSPIGDAGRVRHCPVYAPAEVLPQLETRFGYLTAASFQARTPFKQSADLTHFQRLYSSGDSRSSRV